MYRKYITVKEDVLTYRRLPGVLAVSLRIRNESSQNQILARNKAMNYANGWTSNQYDSIPDTKNPQESSLGFPRKTVWNIARAIGRARAVYARFLFLISELEFMSDCDVPLELYVRNRVSIHDLKDIITTPYS